MKKTIVDFPERSSADLALISEEAGAWLIKLDGDDPLTADESADLREWLLRSPVHKEELTDQARLWGKLNALTELSAPPSRSASKGGNDSAFAALFSFRTFSRPIAATAFVLMAVMAGVVFLMRPDPYLQNNRLYATAVGQQQTTTLADGSILTLNTDTQLRVDYSDEFRVIRMLRGEAHFEVAKKANRPFRVYADDGVIEAIGTAFSVRLQSDRVDLIVAEGAVAVAPIFSDAASPVEEASDRIESSRSEIDGKTLSDADQSRGVVSAGQSAAIRRADEGDPGDDGRLLSDVLDIDDREMARKLSWREGFLTFSGEPLGDAVEEIGRYTTLSIELADPDLKAIRIGGRFPVGETDGMLNALEANFGLRVTRVGAGRILLSAAE